MSHAPAYPPIAADDEALFGWDPTPGIVSVWADREGRGLGAQIDRKENP